MQLVTADLRRRLLANGAVRDADHVPVLKLFDPCGAAIWLIAEMRPDDPDTLFGLCDLGHGFPELGNASLAEIAAVRGQLGLGIERDLHFAGRHPLPVYANLRTGNPARAVAATLEARALARGIAATVLTPAGAGGVTRPRNDVKYAHEAATCGSLPREPE